MASQTLFASTPAQGFGLQVNRAPGRMQDTTRNLLMLAPDSEQRAYSNYNNTTGNNRGAQAFRALIKENLEGACKAIPDCLINLPGTMSYTDNRLTANNHAGRLFEDIIDLVRELRVKADRWDAHETSQRLAGNIQPNDIISDNPDPVIRPFLDEAIRRFMDVRLRSQYYAIRRTLGLGVVTKTAFETDNNIEDNPLIRDRYRQINHFVHGSDMEMDIVLYHLKPDAINARHPRDARALPDRMQQQVYDQGFERLYMGLKRTAAEFLRKLLAPSQEAEIDYSANIRMRVSSLAAEYGTKGS